MKPQVIEDSQDSEDEPVDYQDPRVQYVLVVLTVDVPHLPQPLTYSAPVNLPLEIGDAVLVPLGPSRELIGHVIGLSDNSDPALQAKIKPITGRINGARAFDEDLWQCAEWVCEQTLCDRRDALKLVAPDLTTAQMKTTVHLTPEWESLSRGIRAADQRALLERLSGSPGKSAERSVLLRGTENSAATLNTLRRKGIVTIDRTVSTPVVRTKQVRFLRLAVGADVAEAEAERLARKNAGKQAALLRNLIASENTLSSIPVQGIAVAPATRPPLKRLPKRGWLLTMS